MASTGRVTWFWAMSPCLTPRPWKSGYREWFHHLNGRWCRTTGKPCCDTETVRCRCKFFYRNLQRHRAVLPAIARLLLSMGWRSPGLTMLAWYTFDGRWCIGAPTNTPHKLFKWVELWTFSQQSLQIQLRHLNARKLVLALFQSALEAVVALLVAIQTRFIWKKEITSSIRLLTTAPPRLLLFHVQLDR